MQRILTLLLPGFLLLFACSDTDSGVVTRNLNEDKIPDNVEVVDAFPSITAQKAQSMLDKDKNIIVLDVRTPGEFHEGHIRGARLLDVTQDSTFLEGLKSLEKDRTYIVYCRSGHRSRKACALMQDNGIRDVYNLDGGYLAWPQPE